MTTPVTEETMPKKEFQAVQLQSIQSKGGLSLMLTTFAEVEKFACFMAQSNFVPKHLRGKPADCLAVTLQAMRWEMDPFAVAQKTYFVNEAMGYEAQLVNAIVISRAPIQGRPRLEWSGQGEDLKCKVTGFFIGENEPQVFEAEIKTITTRNAPDWKQQPKKQLGYYALRAWARLYCPDVLMGVYTKDEIENSVMHYGPENAIDVTAQSSIIDEITAGIQAEKASEAPTKEPLPHDPATGEVIEQNKAAAASEEPPVDNEPPLVKPTPLKGNASQTDWDIWANHFISAVYTAPSQEWLNGLQKKNQSLLTNCQRLNPEAHTRATGAMMEKMNDLPQVEAA